jgi:hypothetical protein
MGRKHGCGHEWILLIIIVNEYCRRNSPPARRGAGRINEWHPSNKPGDQVELISIIPAAENLLTAEYLRE